MKIAKLEIENFRCIKKAEIIFDGYALLVGDNNVGKSTICEAIDLALGPERINKSPPIEEFDFYNAEYLK
jgi:putative ATP-dependent endonuclease of OLD family